jgi:predicted PurR-regulated permease PerM
MNNGAVHHARNIRLVALLLCVAAALFALPFWPALLLAAWTAELAKPLMRRISPAVGGRTRGAALLTAMLVTICFVPVVLLAFAAAHEATELYAKLRESGADKSALLALVSSNDADRGDPQMGAQQLMALAKEYGSRAFGVAVALAGTATAAVVGVLVYFWGTFVLLCEGPRTYAWAEKHIDLPPAVTRAFRDAFVETGRGLLIGVGATSVVQSLVATATYMLLGVPRAILLGSITLVFAVIPALGPAIVWLPVAIALFVSGDYTKGGILLGVGVLVIGTVDNLVRPLFVRFGRLQLSSFAVFVGMLGGLTVVGPFGVLLGPLAFRLAGEAVHQRDVRARLPVVAG